MKRRLSISKLSTMFHKTVIISLLISMLVGCNEKIQNENPGNEIEPTLDKYMHDGRLVFKNQETYQNHLNWILINQATPDVIIRYNSGIGLVSMKEIYDEGMELVDNHDALLAFVEKYPRVFERATYIENSMIFDIEAPLNYAYIANKDGLYQVGNTIYRVSYNHTIQIIDGDETKIPLILSYDESIKDPSIGAKPTSFGAKTQLYYSTDYFTDNERMVSRHYENYVDNHYVYSVSTTGQKRVLGVWWQKKLNYIEVSWEEGYWRDCYYTIGGSCPMYPFLILPWTFPANDKADLDYIFLTTQYDVLFDVSYCLAIHKGQLSPGGVVKVKQADALENY